MMRVVMILCCSLLLLAAVPALAYHGGFHPSTDRLPNDGSGRLRPDGSQMFWYQPAPVQPAPVQPLLIPQPAPAPYRSGPTMCVPIGDSGAVYCN